MKIVKIDVSLVFTKKHGFSTKIFQICGFASRRGEDWPLSDLRRGEAWPRVVEQRCDLANTGRLLEFDGWTRTHPSRHRPRRRAVQFVCVCVCVGWVWVHPSLGGRYVIKKGLGADANCTRAPFWARRGHLSLGLSTKNLRLEDI